jgi:hypothetical protein
MAAHFRTMIERLAPIPADHALVAVASPAEPATGRADAAFLASLLAARGQTEAARKRRRAAPAVAIARYRAGRALTDARATTHLDSL